MTEDQQPSDSDKEDALRPETLDPFEEAAKYKDLALRAQAELDNFRKRAIRDKGDAIRYANASLLEKIIPVIDNFDLGLDAARTASDTASVLSGMGMISKQLQDFLGSQGVEAIAALGESFDPTLHEAVSQEFSNEVPEGKILREFRKGYKLKDRLLRASTVVVSKGPAE